jgi:O-antigen/teichoic acid export membrane protein/tetratricopeptide (TPR) repeat protein
VLKARLTRGRVLDALRNPLYRTGYALVGNTIGTTVVGFVYWVIAAHLYSPEAVGRCSALVSALIVVSFLAQLDLQTTLARFLPQAGRSAGRFIAYSYGVTSVTAVAAGVAFVIVLPRLNSHWQFLRTSGSLDIIFVIAVVVWGIFALEDAALTGLHRAVVVPIENSIYGTAKLLLLLVMASLLPSIGIFIAWLIPLVLVVPAVNWLIFRRYARAREAVAASALRAREIIHFAAIDYIGMVFSEGYGYVLPLLVLSILGPAANGSFFVAWTIASGLELVAFNFGTSLLVEGVRAPSRIAELTRGVLARCALVTISGAAVLALGRHLILRIFGSAYVDNASMLLVLLGVATIPYSLVIIAFALDRIERRVGRVTVTQLALAVLTLGSSLLLISKLGINGIGFAWLGASSVVAVARFPTVARAVRQPRAPALAPTPTPQQQKPGSSVHGAEETIILSPLAWETARYQAVTGNVPTAPHDETMVLSPLTWGIARYQGVSGNVPTLPQDETIVFSPLASGAAHDQVVVGNIPRQPPGFMPRPNLLARLKQADSGVFVLTGMPGVGKTQLAAAYARAKLEEGWRLVAWVNAEDTNSLQAGLIAVADAVGLSHGGPGRDAVDAGQLVRYRLEADGRRCLLVFDHAEDLDMLRPFVPVGGAAQVLVTCSGPPMAGLGTSTPVDVFSADEALALLAGQTDLTDEQGAAAVAAELGCLPLALAQASAVIAGEHLGYRTYLARLQALASQAHLVGEDGRALPRNAAEAVTLSLDAAQAGDQGGTCAGVLEIMAVLSGTVVRRELLYAAGRAGVLARRRFRPRISAELVDRALARLADWSLLSFSLTGQTVIAQHVVMQVVRDGLARQGRLAAVYLAGASVLQAHAAALAGSRDHATAQDFLEQVLALRERVTGSATETDNELARMLLSLEYSVLYHLNGLGDRASQAIAVGEILVADSERVLGPDDPNTLTSQNGLAVAYRDAGRASDAIQLFELTLAATERRLGSDHPDTLTMRNNLALAYRDAGRAADAIGLVELTLAAMERRLGPDHPDTLTMRNNLAVAYRDAGRDANAIRLFELTLVVMERRLGSDHPDTLTMRDNLAVAYRDAGRAADAIPLFKLTLATRERRLGPDHPDTLTTRDNLNRAYQEGIRG